MGNTKETNSYVLLCLCVIDSASVSSRVSDKGQCFHNWTEHSATYVKFSGHFLFRHNSLPFVKSKWTDEWPAIPHIGSYRALHSSFTPVSAVSWGGIMNTITSSHTAAPTY